MMVFRDAEFEYDSFELIRGQIHVIKFTQRSNTAGNITTSCNATLCGFFLGAKFNGSILFEIRGQYEVLKVKSKVIGVSKTALGAEGTTFMTHLAYINNYHLVYRVILLSSSIHNIAFVKYIVVIFESRQTPVITLTSPSI